MGPSGTESLTCTSTATVVGGTSLTLLSSSRCWPCPLSRGVSLAWEDTAVRTTQKCQPSECSGRTSSQANNSLVARKGQQRSLTQRR